jgi:hypothetical protein
MYEREYCVRHKHVKCNSSFETSVKKAQSGMEIQFLKIIFIPTCIFVTFLLLFPLVHTNIKDNLFNERKLQNKLAC